MQSHTGKLRLLLVVGVATVSQGCASWEDYTDARGADKADAEVAIFKAHLANTRRIVSASDGRIVYQYDPAQKQTLWSAQHPRVRLLPGQYSITAKTWPFGSLYEFEVDLKAGHKYKVETSLCTLECLKLGKPYRDDRWIQDLTTHERISDVVSECYTAKPRGGERQKVACPDEKDYSDASDSGEADAEVALDDEDYREPPISGEAKPAVAIDEADYRGSTDAGKANVNKAIFNIHPAQTHRIVSASDGRIAYQYNPEQERIQRSAPHIQVLPGQYQITAKTWPFGSLNEFEVDLKAGHTYAVETSLCSLDCILTGEPYRSDRWIQDVTTGKRVSGIESECYFAKPRRGERRKAPCPDD